MRFGRLKKSISKEECEELFDHWSEIGFWRLTVLLKNMIVLAKGCFGTLFWRFPMPGTSEVIFSRSADSRRMKTQSDSPLAEGLPTSGSRKVVFLEGQGPRRMGNQSYWPSAEQSPISGSMKVICLEAEKVWYAALERARSSQACDLTVERTIFSISASTGNLSAFSSKKELSSSLSRVYVNFVIQCAFFSVSWGLLAGTKLIPLNVLPQVLVTLERPDVGTV